jgi:hypothetical protein
MINKSKEKSIAPKNEILTIPISLVVNDPPIIIAIATNKLDPVEIPKIDGPAKGLLK